MKKIFVLLLILAGCYQKEITYEGGPTNAIIVASFTGYYYGYQYANLYSDPPFDTIEVDGYVDSIKMFEEQNFPGGIEFYAYLYLPVNTVHTLKIVFPQGISQGEVNIPESVIITFPSLGDTLSLEEAKLIWKTSRGASWYSFSGWFSFYDSFGYWIGEEYIDTFVKDTFLEIEPLIKDWFSDSGAAGAHVSAYVGSNDGPLPGEGGNIKGVVGGYLYSYGENDYVYFYIGRVLFTAEDTHLLSPEMTHERIFKKYRDEVISREFP